MCLSIGKKKVAFPFGCFERVRIPLDQLICVKDGSNSVGTLTVAVDIMNLGVAAAAELQEIEIGKRTVGVMILDTDKIRNACEKRLGIQRSCFQPDFEVHSCSLAHLWSQQVELHHNLQLYDHWPVRIQTAVTGSVSYVQGTK